MPRSCNCVSESEDLASLQAVTAVRIPSLGAEHNSARSYSNE